MGEGESRGDEKQNADPGEKIAVLLGQHPRGDIV
jgi:hypothetical protein